MKNYKGIDSLDIQTCFDVEIKRCSVPEISVKVLNDKEGDVVVTQDGDTLKIRTKKVRATTVITNSGRTVINSGNATSFQSSINGTVVNVSEGVTYIESLNGACIGDVYVNGKKVSVSTDNAEKVELIKIIVYMPLDELVSLSANLKNQANLTCDAHIYDCELKIEGTGNANLHYARHLKASIEGCGNLTCKNFLGGKLQINVSGKCDANIKGEFSKVLALVSGQGDIVTSGNVKGDYTALVSGMGNIKHYGKIEGDVIKNMSGMGSINI